MVEVSVVTIIGLLVSFGGVFGAMSWRANQAQKAITDKIGGLAVLVEQKDNDSTKELHEHLEKVYSKINELRAELSEFKNLVASEYLKREHLEKEMQRVERHILAEIKAALAKD